MIQPNYILGDLSICALIAVSILQYVAHHTHKSGPHLLSLTNSRVTSKMIRRWWGLRWWGAPGIGEKSSARERSSIVRVSPTGRLLGHPPLRLFLTPTPTTPPHSIKHFTVELHLGGLDCPSSTAEGWKRPPPSEQNTCIGWTAKCVHTSDRYQNLHLCHISGTILSS